MFQPLASLETAENYDKNKALLRKVFILFILVGCAVFTEAAFMAGMTVMTCHRYTQVDCTIDSNYLLGLISAPTIRLENMTQIQEKSYLCGRSNTTRCDKVVASTNFGEVQVPLRAAYIPQIQAFLEDKERVDFKINDDLGYALSPIIAFMGFLPFVSGVVLLVSHLIIYR